MSKTINIGVPSTYYALYQDSIMTDIKLIVDDDCYKCHRAILAGSSGYFIAMFQGGFKESNQNEITLHDIDSRIASLVIAYLYGANIEITSMELVKSLYDLALLWDIKLLIDQCGDYFLSVMNKDNCCQIVSYSNFHTTTFGQKAIDYVSNYFENCLDNQSIKYLTYDVMTEMLDKDKLNVAHEDCILKAITLWVDNDPDQRQTHLISLIGYARLIYVSPKGLLALERRYTNLLQNSKTYLQMIWQIRNYYYFPEMYPNLYVSQRLYYRKRYQFCCCKMDVITIDDYGNDRQDIHNNELFTDSDASEENDAKPSGSICCIIDNMLYPSNEKQIYLRYQKQRHCKDVVLPFACLSFGHKIIIFGGYDSDRGYLAKIIAFDTRERKWTTPEWGVKLPIPLAYFSACKWHNYVYIIGGSTNKHIINANVWRFNIVDCTWEKKAEMKTPRKKFQTIVIDDEIYAIGGCDKNDQIVTQAEKYNPLKNTWERVKEIRSRYENFYVYYIDCKLIIFHDKKSYDCYTKDSEGKWIKADLSRQQLQSHTISAGKRNCLIDDTTCIDIENIYGYSHLMTYLQ